MIEARKVFDFCFQEDTLERCFFVPDVGPNATVLACDITDVVCSEVGVREPIQDQDGLALVSIQVNVTLSLTISLGPGTTPITVTRQIAFPKRVVLCAPMGTDVTCDVRGTCICTVQPTTGQFGTEPNVCCTIQLCITVKSYADVNILIPSFGTVVPKECQVAAAFGGCPPMPPEICGPLRGTSRDCDRDRD